MGFTIRWTPERDEVLEKFKELMWLERISQSDLLMKAIEEYVRRHEKGNPQLRLAPKSGAFIKTRYVNPMVEHRGDLLADLLADIRSRPGQTINELRTEWGRVQGLREETVMEYIKQLRRQVMIRGSKVYPRE